MDCQKERVIDKNELQGIEAKVANLSPSQKQKYMKDNIFLGVSFNFSVWMKNPVRTSLEYARYNVELTEGSEILSITPDTQGKTVQLTQSHQRVQKISLAFKPIQGVDFSGTSGCSYTIPLFIKEVAGARLDSTHVRWDMYGDRAATIPGVVQGATSAAKAFLILKVPKGLECYAKIDVEGSVAEKLAGIITLHGPVKLYGPRKRRISPT